MATNWQQDRYISSKTTSLADCKEETSSDWYRVPLATVPSKLVQGSQEESEEKASAPKAIEGSKQL